MTLLTGSRHLGDEDLIRYMDHQLDREAARLLGAHLRTCPECAARLEEMRKRSAAASAWLAELAVEMPDENRRAVALAAVERARFRRSASGPLGSGWLRAAASILLMLGFFFGTNVGKAWVASAVVRVAGPEQGPLVSKLVEWLDPRQSQAAEEMRRRDEATPAVPRAAGEPAATGTSFEVAPPAAARRMSALVRFSPPGPDVELVFRSIQEGGSATLWMRDVDAASAQVVMGFDGETLATTPDGLEVRNRSDSKADYMITVPTRFRFVRLKVGEQEVLIPIRKSKQEWVWTLNLRTSALD